MSCGAIIMNPPIEIKIVNGKITIEVSGSHTSQILNINDTLSLKSIECLKNFIADVYKIGYSDASEFLMNKK